MFLQRDHTMDKFVRIYYSAVAHRCTLQARLYHLCDNQFGTRNHGADISSSHRPIHSPSTWGLLRLSLSRQEKVVEKEEEEEEPCPQLRNQEEVLRWLLPSAAFLPQSRMEKSPPLHWAEETAVRRPQRRAGPCWTQGCRVEQCTGKQVPWHYMSQCRLQITHRALVISINTDQEADWPVIPYFVCLWMTEHWLKVE